MQNSLEVRTTLSVPQRNRSMKKAHILQTRPELERRIPAKGESPLPQSPYLKGGTSFCHIIKDKVGWKDLGTAPGTEQAPLGVPSSRVWSWLLPGSTVEPQQRGPRSRREPWSRNQSCVPTPGVLAAQVRPWTLLSSHLNL